MSRHPTLLAGAAGLATVLAPLQLMATTYTVGPEGSGRQYTQLSQVFEQNDLKPGDVVEVDGGASYDGDIVVGDDDSGSATSPVVIRWRKGTGGSRPLLEGGGHTIKFEQSNHVVMEGFEVRGGTRSCVFSEANDVTVRNSVIHHCPAHGILGADQNSGSFTLEYSEVSHSGAGTTRHAIYMQSDEVTWPGSVFRMRHNYIHSGTGGLLVRVRHERALIYYNWIEGSVYGELELIGPDCETQKPGWSADMAREDADVVGNVIVHTAPWRNAVRIGGDLNGRSQGRARLVNNTIVFLRDGPANAVMVQLGAGSLEMHNNVVFQAASGAQPAIVRENPPGEVDSPLCGPKGREPWSNGRKVAGSNNWVQTGAQWVPAEWQQTRTGGDPRMEDVAARRFRPVAGSPLVDAGTDAPAAPKGFPFPDPLLLPAYEPPLRVLVAVGGEQRRLRTGTRIDIGSLEATSASVPLPRDEDPRKRERRTRPGRDGQPAEAPASLLSTALAEVRSWWHWLAQMVDGSGNASTE